MSKRDRPTTEASLRAAVLPFARMPRDERPPHALLKLPEGHSLVSSETFRVLSWGGTGHRDALRLGAPWLSEQVATTAASAADAGDDSIEFGAAAAHSDEWMWVPVTVPAVPPREGNVYVTHETGERIPERGELYHRVWIEEGVPPKQVPLAEYEAGIVAQKKARAAAAGDRRRFGETAPLGTRLRTVKTKRDGDCFFSAICKAFDSAHASRDPEMWRTMWERLPPADGSPPPPMPPPTEPPSVCELRRCCGAHFKEEAWLACQAVGGAAFAFIDNTSLDETRRNIARPAADSEGSRTHWADETSLATLQRYLNLRLLVFNPAAHFANQASACGPELPGELPPGERAADNPPPPRYVVLRHTHRGTKEQHYELYALGDAAVLAEEALPTGIKRAFAKVVPGALAAAWRELGREEASLPAGASV